MDMRIHAFHRPRHMFRGPIVPYGPFPGPRLGGPGMPPPPGMYSPPHLPPVGALRVFGPPPHFLGMRGGPPGVMRVRGSFQRPKFAPYVVADRGKAVAASKVNKVSEKPKKEDTQESAAKSESNSASSTKPAEPATNGTITEPGDKTDAKNGPTTNGVPAEMMQPLYCKLCDAKLNGNLQATAHYGGKSHAKRVKQYLQNHGLPVQQGVMTAVNGKTSADKKASTDTLEKFCKLCDVAFTSEIQAKQHYEGRNHKRRMRGEPALPKGFFNPITRRWQRHPPPGVTITGPLRPQRKAAPPAAKSYSCEKCSVSLTSEQQLASHLMGAKHKAREAVPSLVPS